MTTTAVSRSRTPSRRRASMRWLRLIGWVLIAAGSVVLAYVAYALWFTGLETERAQREMGERWEQQVAREPADDDSDDAATATTQPTEHAVPDDGDFLDGADGASAEIGGGEVVAKLEFARPGHESTPVVDEPLFVSHGVSYDHLRGGPGHYPESARPGEDGNFAVAGHRTTYGAPFYALDDLRDGDEVRVTDRTGQQHVYRVVEQEIVDPTANWVLASDPLERGRPTLTLTTCHPRFSARQRMIVFAELVSS